MAARKEVAKKVAKKKRPSAAPTAQNGQESDRYAPYEEGSPLRPEEGADRPQGTGVSRSGQSFG